MFKKIFLVPAIFTLLCNGEDIYLECEGVGHSNHNTKWINNVCQITQKNKQYFEISSKGWKHIERRHTNSAGVMKRNADGNYQGCDDTVESFETIINRFKKTGIAKKAPYFAGTETDRSDFFLELSSEGVRSFNEKPLIFSENTIVLNSVLGKIKKRENQEVSVLFRINRLTGEVFNIPVNEYKMADCKPISKVKYNSVMKEWNDGYKKIKETEKLIRKF